MALIGFAGAVAAAVALWLQWIAFKFPADALGTVRLDVVTADGWRLPVTYRPAMTKRWSEPVLLAHGLANTNHFFDLPGGLSRFLVAAGFDCYTVNFRGAVGPFSLEGHDFTFDDHVRADAPALVSAILAHSKARQLHWIGHSLGGLVGGAYASTLGRTTARQQLTSLTTIGSPVFLKLHPTSKRLLQLGMQLTPAGSLPLHWFARLATPMAGLRLRLPKTSTNLDNITSRSKQYLAAHAIAPVWKGVLGQLYDWLEHGVFRSVDSTVDYRAALTNLQLPMLVIGGTVDDLCLPQALYAHFESLFTTDKTMMQFGRAHGQSVDYGHGDLCVGERAEADVFGPLSHWLEHRSTAVPADNATDSDSV